MNLLEIKNLVKIYKMGETHLVALKGINLSINDGEFVAITGTSGSGKSTLMHLLGCLDIPTHGSYCIDGIDVSTSTRNELSHIRNKKIGFVFQRFYLLPDLTALDNVALPRLYAGDAENNARAEAQKMLNIVELSERVNHYPYQLSGGQQQRVAIARALINKPRIILADEPTGNLDSATGETIMKIFHDLNHHQQVTIILVTHEPYIAHQTKRIIELIDGNIASNKVISS